MKLRFNEYYDIRFSGNPCLARLHYKPEGAEKYASFDYLTAGSDGVFHFGVEGDGETPGVTFQVTGLFRAGHAFKFRDMMQAGPVRFDFQDGKMSIRTRDATIPLEIALPEHHASHEMGM